VLDKKSESFITAEENDKKVPDSVPEEVPVTQQEVVLTEV
jgi:hypothetical protein